MIKSTSLNTFLLLLITCGFLPINAADIIPKPKSYVANGQTFSLSPDVNILYTGDLSALATYLGELLSPATGWDLARYANARARWYKEMTDPAREPTAPGGAPPPAPDRARRDWCWCEPGQRTRRAPASGRPLPRTRSAASDPDL